MTTQFKDREFVKTARCEEEGDQCVTVAMRQDVVGVRDTKDSSKTTLCFTAQEWRAFVKGVKAGEFDV
jgi:hypothetical protein